MAVTERDPHTGYLTTGHEWNGIKELNTPVPRAVYFFLIATALFSLGYWILFPAFPLGWTYTKGLLGVDQRAAVNEALQRASLDRDIWTKQIETKSYQAIQADPALMTIVRHTGRTIFGDNCAACHGLHAKGSRGFPNLTTESWLWGGDPETIAETIRVGINSSHPNSRVAQMLAFGRDNILPRTDVENVVSYVQSLSDPAAVKQVPQQRLDSGKTIFATNCTSCHGDDGKGKSDLGAPDLTDHNWIHGGDPQSIFTTVWYGRQGQMPPWENRLGSLERKILALYLVDLRSRKQ
jgi:cytochrome c oxidase cbb3-type subunit 3